MQNTSNASVPPPVTRRPDVRRRALIITVVATLAIGALLAGDPHVATRHQPPLRFADLLKVRSADPAGEAARMKEVRTRFEQGVSMLHMGQFEYALTAFHQVLALAPQLPEAHVNIGFALVGLEQWKPAHDFFQSAIELRRDQINAYYGLAVALDALGDRPGAMGAMQTYLHRAPADDPFRPRAEAALWEWRELVRGSASRTDAASAGGK